MKKDLSLVIAFLGTVISLLFLSSCADNPKEVNIPQPKKIQYSALDTSLSKEEYYDKVLGALVGSAIGDAMGVATEMWNRNDIQRRHGYILGLTPGITGQSPEGPWGHNLPPGVTTDDTRWKYLLTKYIIMNQGGLDADKFARFIVAYYQNQIKTLGDDQLLKNPDSLDTKIEKVDWIKEWARVSLDYLEDSKQSAVGHRFYGGEMSCAGLLYTPVFGLIAPNPESAYILAYEHTLFDIGYAKDISSLASAMCHMAMHTKNMDSILNVHAFIDPYNYLDSRLVGRIPHLIANSTEDYVLRAMQIETIPLTTSLVKNDSVTLGRIPEGSLAVMVHKDAIRLNVPKGFPGTDLDWYRQETIYQNLEKNQRLIAFHSGEIWEILIAGLKFGQGDFEKTLSFIINYGRDNDTVGAIVGMILGAKDGFSQLPEHLKNEALSVNRDILGIDLEALANELTELVYSK